MEFPADYAVNTNKNTRSLGLSMLGLTAAFCCTNIKAKGSDN